MGRYKRTKCKKGTFKCSDCDQGFKTQIILKRHIEGVHIAARPFKCPECAEEFKLKVTMNRHITFVHCHDLSSMSTCDECGKMVKHLDMHMKFHMKQRKPHVCLICSMKFRTPYLLKIHTHVHTGERPFHCHLCSKTFRQRCVLKNHEIGVHNLNVKPFKCDFCSKSYSLESNLSSHLLKVHAIENFVGFQSSNNDTAQNRRTIDSQILRGKAVPLPINGTKSRQELPADLKWKRFFGVKECSVVLERIDFKKIRMF